MSERLLEFARMRHDNAINRASKEIGVAPEKVAAILEIAAAAYVSAQAAENQAKRLSSQQKRFPDILKDKDEAAALDFLKQKGFRISGKKIFFREDPMTAKQAAVVKMLADEYDYQI